MAEITNIAWDNLSSVITNRTDELDEKIDRVDELSRQAYNNADKAFTLANDNAYRISYVESYEEKIAKDEDRINFLENQLEKIKWVRPVAIYSGIISTIALFSFVIYLEYILIH